MESESINHNIKNIFKGVAISLIMTMILLLVYALILAYTDVSEKTLIPVITIITAICILIGSSIGNMKIKKNGLLNGASIGGVYMIILYLISSIWNWKFKIGIQSLGIIGIGIIFGIIGGIVGVNKK